MTPLLNHQRRTIQWQAMSLGHLSVCIVLHALACIAAAAPIEENIPPSVDIGVAKGLTYLARQQQVDGSFTGFDEQGPRMAPVAEALLAFLSAGQTPGAGRHALIVRSAMDFIIRQLPEDGEFGRSDGSGLVGHATITMALAQAHGLEADSYQRSIVTKALEKSLGVILAMQDTRNDPRAGGWRKEGAGEGDLASTLGMVLALRSLQDAGYEVPKQALKRAAAFARSCFRKDSHAFANPSGNPTALSNAAGIAIILLADRADDELKEAIKFLRERRVGEDMSDYHAALYATTLAAMLVGESAWNAEWRPTRDGLLSKQAEDGSWFPPRPPSIGLGTVSATSFAVMTLAMPYRLLPMYGVAMPRK